MPNNLTGDFEAVFELSIAKINALLATMHQRAIDPKDSPAFPHSVTIPIHDAPSFLPGVSSSAVKWITGFGNISQGGTDWKQQVANYYMTKPLPFVSALYEKAATSLADAGLVQPPGDKLRGTVFAQISTPSLTLRTGSTKQVIVSVDVRARYFPESGTKTLPAPIHGKVSIVYDVAATEVNGRHVVHVQPPTNDSDTSFWSSPSAGLSSNDINTVADRIRKILRTHFIPDDVDLPADLPVSQFIALGSSGETIALPIQLSGNPGGNLSSVTQDLRAGNDFALAVSKEYVNTFFANASQALKNYASGVTINVDTPAFSTVYHVTADDLTVTWKAGAIDVSGHFHAHTRSALPDQDINFTQSLVLDLNVPAQWVDLKPAGDPSVTESSLVSHDDAVNNVKQGRDTALKNLGIGAIFNDIRNKLSAGLQRFDKNANARYLTADITPDGMLLRGKVDGGGSWIAPIVIFDETDSGNALTAFQSWIPGGTIDSFHWSWPEGPAWFSQVGHQSDSDRFDVQKTAGMQQASRICLVIEGTRVAADGSLENITAGQRCKPTWSEPLLVVPYEWVHLLMPLWAPNPSPEAPLEDSVLGHINLAGPSNQIGQLVANTLIHFTGTRANEPLQTLSQVMMQSRRQDASLVLILVLPRGTFQHSRLELERKLGAMNERFAGTLFITEDYEGGWTQAFSTKETPATYLLNARREFALSQFGEVDARHFAAALDQHMVAAPRVRSLPMPIEIDVGAQIPADIVLMNDTGKRVKLGRLRGRSFVLCFWKSWSHACLRQLRSLQQNLDHRVDNQPLVFGINCGESRETIAKTRHEHHLTLPLLQDPEHTVASRFGIRCWPTNIRINPDGIVEQIQFGLTLQNRASAT